MLVLLTLLISLTGKDKAKWLLILIPLLVVIRAAAGFLFGNLADSLFWLVVILSFYYAIACVSERITLPGKEILTADEELDFKASGSVLGYLIFAMTVAIYAVYYLVGESLMNLEYLHSVNTAAAALLILIAVLLFTVGKMRFTPVMFMLMGLTDLIAMYSQGAMFIGCGILVIVIGLFALLRKESRILPGIMLIVYGFSYFISAYISGNLSGISVILNVIPCLIAVYLAFAVYSQDRLPLF